MDLETCPVCEKDFVNLPAHLDSHFAINCPICSEKISESEIQQHTNSHFEETSTTKLNVNKKSSFIPLLQNYLIAKEESGVEIYFCHSSTCHYPIFPADKGWGCGYRNVQMILSAIASFENAVPEIQTLQKHLDSAHRLGFDPVGFAELGNVTGTTKWIGAVDVLSMLFHFGISAYIADFNQTDLLLNFVYDLFKESSDPLPPLYLQWSGHSVTVIGVKKENNNVSLILFDPSDGGGVSFVEMSETLKNLSLPFKFAAKTFYKDKRRLRRKQYQLVILDKFSSTDESIVPDTISFTQREMWRTKPLDSFAKKIGTGWE